MSIDSVSSESYTAPTDQEKEGSSKINLHEKIQPPSDEQESSRGYSLLKHIQYETSLAYTQASSQEAIPLKNKDHLQKIQDAGVSPVI